MSSVLEAPRGDKRPARRAQGPGQAGGQSAEVLSENAALAVLAGLAQKVEEPSPRARPTRARIEELKQQTQQAWDQTGLLSRDGKEYKTPPLMSVPLARAITRPAPQSAGKKPANTAWRNGATSVDMAAGNVAQQRGNSYDAWDNGLTESSSGSSPWYDYLGDAGGSGGTQRGGEARSDVSDGWAGFADGAESEEDGARAAHNKGGGGEGRERKDDRRADGANEAPYLWHPVNPAVSRQQQQEINGRASAGGPQAILGGLHGSNGANAPPAERDRVAWLDSWYQQDQGGTKRPAPDGPGGGLTHSFEGEAQQAQSSGRPAKSPRVAQLKALDVHAAQVKLELEAQIKLEVQLKIGLDPLAGRAPQGTVSRRGPNHPRASLGASREVEDPNAAGVDDRLLARAKKPTAKKPRAPRAAAKDSPRPFKCEYEGCDYAATQRRYIIEHTRVHTGARPYKCPWEGCQYASSGSGHMARHVRTHTGDRPYACKEPGCGYFASQSGHLRTHMRKHTGERPFKCMVPGCTYAAGRSGHLSRHMKVHATAGAVAAAAAPE